MVPNGALSYKLTWKIRTPLVGPKVSIIHRFHCTYSKYIRIITLDTLKLDVRNYHANIIIIYFIYYNNYVMLSIDNI